jgi:thymidine phosphorylase
MGQPLGRMAGHSNEIRECIEVLSGLGPPDLRELSIELSAWMFFLGGKTLDVAAGRELASRLISDGTALQKFRQVVELQGGDVRLIDEPQRFAQARSTTQVLSPGSGFIASINCENLGTALAILGGGRATKEDRIDHAVGLEFHQRVGARIERGQPLVTIHYNADAMLAEAQSLITDSYEISAAPPKDIPPLIFRVIGGPEN